jgi:hypothetical protein
VQLLIEGTESSPGYIHTPMGSAAPAAGNGLALGLADDLANEALQEIVASGILNISLPDAGTTFDTIQLAATSPPMIGAAPDGMRIRLVLPDMMMTFMNQGASVAVAALNAEIDVKIAQASGSSSLAIDLGTPSMAMDVIEDNTGSATAEPAAGSAAGSGVNDQLGSIVQMLSNIPLPTLEGLTLSSTSASASNGYVLVKTTLH